MSTKTVSVPFVFRVFEFMHDIRVQVIELGLTMADCDVLCGVGTGLVNRFANGEEDNMKMSSFLKVCNGLDLDPRKYFELRG